MKGEERMFWELFCATGAPQYYSMYVRARENGEGAENKKRTD